MRGNGETPFAGMIQIRFGGSNLSPAAQDTPDKRKVERKFLSVNIA